MKSNNLVLTMSIGDYYNEVAKLTLPSVKKYAKKIGADYQMALKYYDLVEMLTEGQGIAALRKKPEVVKEDFYY